MRPRGRLYLAIAMIAVLSGAAGCAATDGHPPTSARLSVSLQPRILPPRPPAPVLGALERLLGRSAEVAAPGVSRAPQFPRRFPDSLPPGVFPDYAETGYEIMAGLRNGEAEDKIVAKAACYVMSQAAEDDPSAERWENQIYDVLGDEFEPAGLWTSAGTYNEVVSGPVSRAAEALSYASRSGGVRQYYFKYCFSWSGMLGG